MKAEQKKRTEQQNKYLHGGLIPFISAKAGKTQKLVKDDIKRRFGVKSTSALSTVEFETLMSRVRTWASIELRCYVPAPNECPAFS
jgi:hypothetical protein